MFELVRQFFDTLIGYSLPAGVYEIMSFALISTIFSSIFTFFDNRTRKMFDFAARICIVVLAVLVVASSTNLSIILGG